MLDLNQTNVTLAVILSSTTLDEFIRRINEDENVTCWEERHAYGVFSSDKMLPVLLRIPVIKTPCGIIYLPTPLGGIRLEAKENRKSRKRRFDIHIYSNTFIDFVSTILGLEERSRFSIKSIEDLRHVYLRAHSMNSKGDLLAWDIHDSAMSSTLTPVMVIDHWYDGMFRTHIKVQEEDQGLPATHARYDKYFEYFVGEDHA